MINKINLPDKEQELRETYWSVIAMGGDTGRGEGHGIAIGDTSANGRLMCWYPKGREQFPGAGTHCGGGEENGVGSG